MPGQIDGDSIVPGLVGLAGASVVVYALLLFGLYEETRFSLGSNLTATLDAIILLAIYRLITRRAA